MQIDQLEELLWKQSRITRSGLYKILVNTQPGIVVVSSIVLRRTIKLHQNIQSIGLQLPHQSCYVLRREEFLALVSKKEISRNIERLPEWVILFPKPKRSLLKRGREFVLRHYWRLLFHALIDLSFKKKQADKKFQTADLLERIHQIGQTEFDEIRSVLKQMDCLLPTWTNTQAYREFVSTYWELAFFDPKSLEEYFPGLVNRKNIEELLSLDIKAQEIFENSQPDPTLLPIPEKIVSDNLPESCDETAIEGFLKNQELPDLAVTKKELEKNPVRMAIQKVKALRSGKRTRSIAISPSEVGVVGFRELFLLAEALREGLGDKAPEPSEWLRALIPLLYRCSEGTFRPEARLLFDLQKAALDYFHEVHTTDLVGFVLSLGKKKINRPLPLLKGIRILKHLRKALKRATSLRVPLPRVLDLLKISVRCAEQNVRESARGILINSIKEVGLVPKNFPERVARDKLVEELLDYIVERGFLDMGQVRDSLSRNQLKIDDLSSVGEFFSGNVLLRLNRKLEYELDGIYKPAEIYLRTLQSVSALMFGTVVGRFLVKYGILPFGGSYVLLEGLHHIVGPLSQAVAGKDLHISTPTSVVLFGVFLLLLIHIKKFRNVVFEGFGYFWDFLVFVFLKFPSKVFELPAFKAVINSIYFRFFSRFIVRPALMSAILSGILPVFFDVSISKSLVVASGVFVAMNIVLNSRVGRNVEEFMLDGIAWSWQRFRYHIVPGLIRLVLNVFKKITDRIERTLYAVDEWLLFRKGQNQSTFVFKVAFGVVWFAVTYLVRIYVNLLIEPQINPVKHFPVVTVSHKIILPFSFTITRWLSAPLDPILGQVISKTIVGTTVFLLPGVFGFLVWEFKENWRLFAANRSPSLKPVQVGSHGETLIRLMRPGFHSGTLPKLFKKLRKAEKVRAHRRAQAVSKVKQELHHTEHAVQLFIEREFLSSLNQCQSEYQFSVSRIYLASNRIQIRLEISDFPDDPVVFSFEEQSGWLLGGVSRRGWIEMLPEEHRARFTLAQLGLYTLCGVQLIREQIKNELPRFRYDVAAKQLIVWAQGEEKQWAYDFYGARKFKRRMFFSGAGEKEPPKVLSPNRILCSWFKVPWSKWVEEWEESPSYQPSEDKSWRGGMIL